MKILIVSYNFPPENVIGAVRVGKLAKYLHDRGYELRVLAASPSGDTSLPLEIPAELVIHSTDWNIDGLFDPFVNTFRTLRRARNRRANTLDNSPSSGAAAVTTRTTRLKERLQSHYYALLRIPDARAGWLKNATTAGQRLLSRWQPDIILASAPPVTSLFVAAALAKQFHIPWIAELRDLWVENPYYAFPPWRKVIDRWLEQRVLGQAAMLVTVTPLGGLSLQRKYEKPVSVILNGYEDEVDSSSIPSVPKGPGKLSIVYTGTMYRGRRDPSALFAAISKMTSAERNSLAIYFYGPAIASISDLAADYAVNDCVTIRPSVGYIESLNIQRNADVLLLLGWNDPRDAGNIPAKFFEYIAAARPILSLGYEHGTIATWIRERNAGFVSNSPDRIAAHLSSWIQIRKSGAIPALPHTARSGLSRSAQFGKLESVLAKLVDTPKQKQ